MSRYHRFEKIDRLLKTAAKNHRLEVVVVRQRLVKAWSEIVAGLIKGAEEASRVFDFDKGVLSVACLNQNIAYQIKVLSKRIIHALNEFLGGNFVFAISIEI